MWSIGAFLELDDRQKLEQYIRTNGEFVLDLPRIEDQSEDTMFDYFVNDNGEWQHPENFEKSFLSLLSGNKNDIHFYF